MPKVAIIGGGASGMRAAFDLVDRKVDVIVYEAASRMGGRLLTETVGSEAVDLGAESFEAGLSSAWVEELKSRGILGDSIELVDPFADAESRIYWYPEGKKLLAAPRDSVTSSEAYELTNQRFAATVRSAADVPVCSGVELSAPGAAAAWSLDAYSAFVESIEPDSYSAQDRSRSAASSDDLRPMGPAGPVGIGSLFEEYGRLLQLNPRAKVRLASPPLAIDEGPTGGWIVTTSGPVQDQVDAVIVTVSVNVLAREGVALPPSVRSRVRDAVDGLALGGYLKVALHWPAAAKALGTKARVDYYLPPGGLRAWQISKLAKSEVLVLATAGGQAFDLTDADGTSAVKAATTVIQTILETGDEPLAAKASAWIANPNIGGAYSYTKPGAGGVRPSLSEKLTTAFAPRGLFFAGEALSVPCYGSLEATFSTGRAAARMCLTALKITSDL